MYTLNLEIVRMSNFFLIPSCFLYDELLGFTWTFTTN